MEKPVHNAVSHFSCLWFEACVVSVITILFPLPLNVFGRLCSVIVAVPGHLHYILIFNET